MKWMFFTLLFFIAITGNTQNATELKRRAKDFFAAGRYEDALTTLTNSRELSRNDEEGRFLLAICYFQLNRLNESLDLLKALTESEKTPYPECWFYLGKVYHARHQFLDAANYYKIYLKNGTPDPNARRLVADMVRRCANGQQLQYQPPKAFVENLGPNVNTKYDEFAPVTSPNYEDRLYFSSIRMGNAGGKRNDAGITDERTGHYFSDMFFCNNEKGTWSSAQPMSYQLNSPRHEMLLDFNKDGSALIYQRGLNLKTGDIIVDTFRKLEERLVSSDPLLAPVRPKEGDEMPCFFNDTLIFFASNRPGGFGGLDIYKTALRNGRWNTPENLGADINTPYDETSPFLCRDTKTMYFSSNNVERSMGGLDVLKTQYVPEIQRWTEPKNLGLPINSAADEENFRLSRDGFTGFFASNRKDGLGQRDLYIAYFNDYLTEQDPPNASKPVADEEITNPTGKKIEKEEPAEDDLKIEHPAGINTRTNRWFFKNDQDLLSPSNKRNLDQVGVQLAENQDQKLVITVYALDATSKADGLYIAINSAEKVAKYLIEKGIATEAIFMRGALPDNDVENQDAPFALLLEPVDVGDFRPKGSQEPGFDELLHQGLHYKIQIGSSKSKLKSPFFDTYPHSMVEKALNFEYLRYTVGAVKTFAEAQKLRQEIVNQGISGAFIVPYIYGIRADKTLARTYLDTFPDLANFIK